MIFPIEQEFKLTDNFIDKYKDKIPPFGFNGLGEFVFMRTYSRIKEDGKNETWLETVRRVVEGIYTIQKQHIEDYKLGWNSMKAQKSAQEMFDRIFNFKMLPAGRSLWAMGTPLIMKKGLASALYNCAFLSTENIAENPAKSFTTSMDMLMCGIGVGFDILGKDKIKVKEPKNKIETYVIPDSREGWIKSLELLIMSFFGQDNFEFDYSLIRAEGEPIKTFGGTSAGPQPLKDLHIKVKEILNSRIGEYLTERNIVDIFNLIGKTVVSGNVRRSAEIALGYPTEEFLNLKNYELNPERFDFGWASNNSVFSNIGDNYLTISERIRDNAEPGLAWLENLRKYGRMKESESDYKDHKIAGLNPCAEIGLENSELCNLVETFPHNHESLDDYKITLKYAYLYGKSVTLLNTHWEDTNRVMLRNRRIGLSITGTAQFIAKQGIKELKKWMEEGYETVRKYDKIYSDWFAIPQSIKVTTIKPSGTVSILAGATPGIHYPESIYYIRRVRLSKNSPFVPILENSGYKIEKAIGQEESTIVVEFPVFIGENVRVINDVSMWEQLNLAAFAQEHWADNSVSATITFDPKKDGKDIKNALNYFQFKLKAISFLPKTEDGAYPQMPYEEITKEKYNEIINNLTPLNFSELFSADAIGEKYCNNEGCEF
jgi:adenosylcobalamin-dependent ribonucleoside-triphosphate reductase